LTRYDDCIDLISVVAEALGPYRSEVVFVGGAIAGLLMSAPRLVDVRPTDDVDVVIETTTYSKYNKVLEDLRKLGFAHDMSGPLCRFTINGVKLDIMPTEEAVLGFKNRWYPMVVQTAKPYVLPNGTEIQLVTAPAFICTKLEAFRDRGRGDFLASPDIEDIVAVINGRHELIGESWGTPLEMREYLHTAFQELANNEDFLSAMPGILPHVAANRESIVRFRVEQLARIPTIASFSGQVMVNYATSPLSIDVISMEGTDQTLGSRDFRNATEFLSCLQELGIPADSTRIRSDAFNELKRLVQVPLEILAKWNLLNPLD
jgi:predicted nucleotidyltransferase